jgi:hypothetical protein
MFLGSLCSSFGVFKIIFIIYLNEMLCFLYLRFIVVVVLD